METGIVDLESNADSTCCKEQGDPSKIGETPPFLELLCSLSPVRWLLSWRSVPPRKLTASMPKTKLGANGGPCYKLLKNTRTDKLKSKVRVVRVADPGCNSLTLNMSARHTAAGGEACVLCLLDCARVMSRCKVSALQSSFRHCYGTMWHAHASCLPESCSHAAM